MSYNELKKQQIAFKKELITIKNQKTKLLTELQSIEKDKLQAEQKYQSEYSKEKALQLMKYSSEMIAPIENEIASTKKGIEEEEKRYHTDLNSLSEEDALAQCSSQKDIILEVEKSSDLVSEQLTHLLGSDFYNTVNNQLNLFCYKLNEQSLGKAIAYFNKCSEDLSKMNCSKFNIDDKINRVTDYINNFNLEQFNTTKSYYVIILIVSFVLLLLFCKKLFPIYVIALIIYIIYEILHCFKINSILIANKVVKDNVDFISESLKKEVLEILENQRLQMQEEHEKSLVIMNSNLEDLKKQLDRQTIEAQKSFQFDDSKLQEKHNSIMDSFYQKQRELQEKLKSVETNFNKVNSNLSKIVERLGEELGSLQNEYLNFDKIGTETVFNPKFLVDIVDNKPIFYEHPESSCLFVYENIDDVFRLVRLLNVELRTKLSPFSFTSTVYDSQYLCSNYLSFVPNQKQDGDFTKIFKILSDISELKDEMKHLENLVNKRNISILREFKNIVEYNNKMLEIDSLTESYQFYFLQDVEKSIITSAAMRKVLLNGGKLGIFIHLFLKSSDFFSYGAEGEDLVQNVAKIYHLRNGEICERAKEYVLENMIKKNG